MFRLPKIRNRQRSRGQSVVEFALTLPVLLILMMMALDFGRVFLGWVNLNNTARIAANYAATNAVKMAAGDPATFDAYYALIQKDATAINCKLPAKATFPHPTFPDGGTALGQSANVGLSCQFSILTPVISQVLGNPLMVSASADFPIRSGVVAGVPGGGPPAPVAAFNISPTGGTAPVSITFTDASINSPTTYAWDFNGDGTVDWATSTPPPYTYTIPKTYQASLTVSNGLVSSTATRTIVIAAPSGPIADFTATPQTGTAPLLVTLTNTSTSAAPITSYVWDFGDSTTSTAAGPFTKTYAAGTWTVKLTVTDSNGLSSTATKAITVSPAVAMCTVPDFKNVQTSPSVQTTWTTAGFTTTVIFNPSRPPEYKITKQSLTKNTSVRCDSTITVYDH